MTHIKAMPFKSMKAAKASNSNFKDFTGAKLGKQIVCGYLGDGNWQLICSCGAYSSRTTANIKKGKGYAVCEDCRDKLMVTRKDVRSPLSANDFIAKYA